jgi:hypothetical protein
MARRALHRSDPSCVLRRDHASRADLGSRVARVDRESTDGGSFLTQCGTSSNGEVSGCSTAQRRDRLQTSLANQLGTVSKGKRGLLPIVPN